MLGKINKYYDVPIDWMSESIHIPIIGINDLLIVWTLQVSTVKN